LIFLFAHRDFGKQPMFCRKFISVQAK
jgi:hypothetical protein